MEKIKNVKEFVEKLDAAKKVNPKDHNRHYEPDFH